MQQTQATPSLKMCVARRIQQIFQKHLIFEVASTPRREAIDRYWDFLANQDTANIRKTRANPLFLPTGPYPSCLAN